MWILRVYFICYHCRYDLLPLSIRPAGYPYRYARQRLAVKHRHTSQLNSYNAVCPSNDLFMRQVRRRSPTDDGLSRTDCVLICDRDRK